MYDIKYENELWWITKDGRIIEDLGSYLDPISPKIIIKEILNEREHIQV